MFLRFTIALLILTASSLHAAVTVSVNGVSHTIPQTNEKGWGNNVTAWIQAISLYSLQPTGGTFTLTAETNFGATYGLKAPYYKSATSNISTAGVLRLARADSIGWRNQANGANLLLEVDSSNRLTFDSVLIPTATAASVQDSTFTIYDNGDTTKKIAFQASGISASTTRTITVPDSNVDLGGLVNANIASGAAIGAAKLVDGSVSDAELQYVGGLTSDAQTQLDAKVAKSTGTTKGDILVFTGSATVVRQGIGTDGHVLVADSAQTNGLKWAANPSAPNLAKEVITADGNFTVPVGTVAGTVFKFTITGGGGGGGGANSAASNPGGNGGGAGATCVKWLSGLTAGNTIVVDIGAAAAGGTATNAGTAGNASTIASGTETITTVTAAGGSGGAASASNAGAAAGGGCTNADFSITGGSGSLADSLGALATAGGLGGGSFYGSGGVGGGSGGNNAGAAGAAFGSGGGGGGGEDVSGGNGAIGVVVVEWAL